MTILRHCSMFLYIYWPLSHSVQCSASHDYLSSPSPSPPNHTSWTQKSTKGFLHQSRPGTAEISCRSDQPSAVLCYYSTLQGYIYTQQLRHGCSHDSSTQGGKERRFDTAVFVRGQGKESSTPWPTTEQWNNVIIISTHFNH